MAQSVARLIQEPEFAGLIPDSATFFRFPSLLIQGGQLSVSGESMCT